MHAVLWRMEEHPRRGQDGGGFKMNLKFCTANLDCPKCSAQPPCPEFRPGQSRGGDIERLVKVPSRTLSLISPSLSLLSLLVQIQ